MLNIVILFIKKKNKFKVKKKKREIFDIYCKKVMAFLRTIPRVSSRKNIVKCFGLTDLSSKINNVGIKTSSQLLQITERKYSNDASASSQSGVCGIKPASRQIDSLDLKFDDPIASFKSKKTMELIRAYLVYQICTIDFVVENNMKVYLLLTIYSFLYVLLHFYFLFRYLLVSHRWLCI